MCTVSTVVPLVPVYSALGSYATHKTFVAGEEQLLAIVAWIPRVYGYCTLRAVLCIHKGGAKYNFHTPLEMHAILTC